MQHADPAEPAALEPADTSPPELFRLAAALPLGQLNARALDDSLRSTPVNAVAGLLLRGAAARAASEQIVTAEWPRPLRPTSSAPSRKQNCLSMGGGKAAEARRDTPMTRCAW